MREHQPKSTRMLLLPLARVPHLKVHGGIHPAFCQRMKIFAALFLCFALSSPLYGNEAGRRILAEINFARTQPQTYAGIVASSGSGSRAAGEAVRFLERAAPLPPLEYSDALSQAALSHVIDQGGAGGFGHAGSDGARSFDRIARYGQWQGAVGENIDYGSRDARTIVVRLIVDDGIAGRKHRVNIFNKSYRVAGIAAGAHTRYGGMCVMDFAGDFIARGNGLATR